MAAIPGASLRRRRRQCDRAGARLGAGARALGRSAPHRLVGAALRGRRQRYRGVRRAGRRDAERRPELAVPVAGQRRGVADRARSRWRCWSPTGTAPPGRDERRAPAERTDPHLVRLVVAYGLFGFGYVITATFLVAIVRGTPAIRALEPVIWVVFGLAAAPSVALWARIATRVRHSGDVRRRVRGRGGGRVGQRRLAERRSARSWQRSWWAARSWG